MYAHIDPIGIADTYAEAYDQIMRFGAREMMVRELAVNAIEAAMTKPPGQRLVRLYGTEIPLFGDTRKLAIWNRGGMSPKEFRKFSEIKYTGGGKVHSPDDHLGRGAKIASISSNKLGLRYRTWWDGRVYEVLLVADEESGRVGRAEVGEGTPVDGTTFMRDVTSQYENLPNSKRHPIFCLDEDWTEVVLCGNQPNQDTTQRPYEDIKMSAGAWLFRMLGLRFLRIPEGVDCRVHSSITQYHPTDYWMEFDTIEKSLERAANHSVKLFGGGKVWYIQHKDETAGNIRSDQTRGGKGFAPYYASERTFGGIVHKGEIHYLHSGSTRGIVTPTSKPWQRLALDWGLLNTCNKVSILVELDDNAVYPNQTRTGLFDVVTRVEIDPVNYAHIVRDNRPDWLIALEASLEPQQDEQTKLVRDRLRDLMRSYRLEFQGFARSNAGDLQLEGDQSGGGAFRRQGPPQDRPREPSNNGTDQPRGRPGVNSQDGLLRAKRMTRLLDAPDFRWKPDSWFEDDAGGQAAMWQPATAGGDNIIFLNEEHTFFRALVSKLAAEAPPAAPEIKVEELAKREAKLLCEMNLGTRVIGALVMLEAGLVTEDELRDKTLHAKSLTPEFMRASNTKEFFESVANIRRTLRTYRHLGLDEGEAAYGLDEGEAA
jgi:hypothetical protein